MLKRNIKPEENDIVKENILQSIEKVRQEISDTYNSFNHISDMDLTECLIHKLNALNAEHSYLIKQARQMSISHQPTVKF